MNEQGFSIGAGEKFGLFISSEMTKGFLLFEINISFLKGSTSKCDTFNNDLLTSSTDF